MARYRVGTPDEFSSGFRKVLTVGDREIVVLRENGRFYAFHNWCLHQGGPVGEGVVTKQVCMVIGDHGTWEGDRFSDDSLHLVCPWHGWEYDLETGVYAGNDALRLTSYDVVEDSGEVFVVCED